MRNWIRVLNAVTCLVFLQTFVSGQELSVSQDTTKVANNTLTAKDSMLIAKKELHSPKRATIYEALLPGLGHVYNKKYWHLPITYAAFGTTVFFIIDNTKKYQKYRNAYEDFSLYRKYIEQSAQFPIPIPEPTSQRFRKVLDADYLEFTPRQIETFQRALKNNKDAFRRYRDLSYISLVAVYILNVVWATVDAHFFYYDVSDDLSLRIQPQMLIMQDYKQGFGVNLVLNF